MEDKDLSVNENQNSSGESLGSLRPAETDRQPGFTTLGQEFYKDDNGRDVAASTVEFLAPYLHVCDGFYKWECGRCRRSEDSRACGWPIAGQVLKCGGCGALNLLIKTNTVELDALVRKKNQLEIGLQDLARDQEQFNAEVTRAATHRIQQLEHPLRSFLAEIEAANQHGEAGAA